MAQVKRHRSPHKEGGASSAPVPTIRTSPSKSANISTSKVSISQKNSLYSPQKASTSSTLRASSSTQKSSLFTPQKAPSSSYFPSTAALKTSTSTTATQRLSSTGNNCLNIANNKPSPFKQMLNMKKSHIYNLEHRKKPDELRRKDLISAMKLPDHETLNRKDYLKILDPWKQEWERGVQVPVDADALPKVNLRQFNQDSPSNKRTVSCDVSIRQSKVAEAYHRPEDRIDYEASSDVIIGKYELDLQDISWLSAVRDSELSVYISDTLMEDVINELEQECARNMKDDNIGIEFFDDTVCDVCQNGEVEDGNEIVFCEQCNIGVHQACYGVEDIPEDDWLCNVCRTMATTKHDARRKKPCCVLCPKVGGAMKPTTSKHKWAHVACAYWIPEVQFMDYFKLEPIDYKMIHAGRWNRVCGLCNIKKGATICCEEAKCFASFHVTCAFKHRLKMKIISQPDSKVAFKSYCMKHSDINPENGVDIYQQSTSTGSRKQSTSSDSKETPTKNKRHSPSKNAEFWKHVDLKKLIDNITKQHDLSTDLLQPAVIAPGTRLEYDESHLKQVIEMIFQYWKLKRICNYGNSLIKLTLAQKFEEHMNSTYHRMKSFRFHMERLRTIGYMIYKRDKAKELFYKAQKEVFQNMCKAFLFKDSLPVADSEESQQKDSKVKESASTSSAASSSTTEWNSDMYIEDHKLCKQILPHHRIYNEEPVDKKKELNVTKYLLRQLKKIAESDRIHLSTVKSLDNPYARTYRLQRTNSELKLLEASTSKKRSKSSKHEKDEQEVESLSQPRKRLKMSEEGSSSPSKKVKKNLSGDFDKVINDVNVDGDDDDEEVKYKHRHGKQSKQKQQQQQQRTYNFRRSPAQDEQHSNDSDSHQKENTAKLAGKFKGSETETFSPTTGKRSDKLVKGAHNNGDAIHDNGNDGLRNHHSRTKRRPSGHQIEQMVVDSDNDPEMETLSESSLVLRSNNTLTERIGRSIRRMFKRT